MNRVISACSATSRSSQGVKWQVVDDSGTSSFRIISIPCSSSDDRSYGVVSDAALYASGLLLLLLGLYFLSLGCSD